MEHARTLEPVVAGDESPLARARLHLQLTVDEAARRSNVSPEEVQWLEEGRLYRFPTPDHALLSTVLYATGLGLEHRDALELAGLPAPPKPLGPWRRLAAVAAIGGLVLAATLAVVLADGPDLDPTAIDRLVESWQHENGDVVAATYGGVRLHPVLLARSAWPLVPDEGARGLEARLLPCDDLTPPGDVDVRR